jgi:hypothetical protein
MGRFLRALTVVLALMAVAAAAPANVAARTATLVPASGPGEPIVLWDGHSPMVEGTTYALPQCWPLNTQSDKDAPCLVSITSMHTSRSAKVSEDGYDGAAPLTTDLCTCGVNVKNAGGTAVAKLWEDITITWLQYTWQEVGASRGTWVKNWMYSWSSLWGPTPGSGTFTYASGQSVRVGGTINYLGTPWGTYTVYLTVFGNQNWHCSIS